MDYYSAFCHTTPLVGRWRSESFWGLAEESFLHSGPQLGRRQRLVNTAPSVHILRRPFPFASFLNQFFLKNLPILLEMPRSLSCPQSRIVTLPTCYLAERVRLSSNFVTLIFKTPSTDVIASFEFFFFQVKDCFLLS